MKAAYVKAPFQFDVREMSPRDITDEEVLVLIRTGRIHAASLVSHRFALDEIRPVLQRCGTTRLLP